MSAQTLTSSPTSMTETTTGRSKALSLRRGFLGVSTMPGLLLTDWFDSAIGATYGMEGHDKVMDAMEGMWGIPVFILPGMIGLVLGLPLAMAALWRAGLGRWWGFAASVAAFAAFMILGATVVATVVSAAFLSVVAVALHRATASEHAG